VICPSCGKENPDVARFCLNCGTALADATRAAPRVREERRIVTVLFADLVGFTSQAERMDPEEVRALLQPYHERVRADLIRWGGTVEKFIGDAVMALCGAPVAHEDDPERAARAALTIRDGLTADGQLHVRIGITTGEALVALDARPEAGEGMAAGDVVNAAARLQAAARVDGILVDEATYRATSRRIEYREHEPVTVKGKAEPVRVREAVSARSQFGVDVRQLGQAPLVGRLREIDLLAGALERVKSEREPQLVTLVGVPGIGKSRLVWELFQQTDAASDLVAWRQGRSLPYGEAISFWALGEIVKAEAGILETDSTADAEAKLGLALSALSLERADAEWIGRHLRPLVGLEAPTELHGDRRGEAFAAWRRFLEALADQRPLVLVFEDLQWGDDGLLDFVDHLVDWATGVPLLIVGTARPELLSRRPGWGGGKPNALTVSLPPLSDSEAGRLVAAMVEHAVIPAALREVVLERAQGNPLYAEEFARLVSEGGRIDGLPESVQGIIAARLDTLSRDEKELIQAAAVVGKVFWSGAVGGMQERSRAEVEEALHGLERREFVRRERRSSVAGETEYAFRHILVRDVAYGQIPRGMRAERHVQTAGWLESLGRSADHAELLAQHYLSAIELARAAGQSTDPYARRALDAVMEAGERAMALNAYPSAARYFESAIELMPADDPKRPAALFRYGKALRFAEEAGADVLADAEAALRSVGDLESAAEAAVLQAELAWFGGDGPSSAAHLERAGKLVDHLPASASKAFVLSDLSRYHMLAARHQEAISVGRQALEVADALGLDEIRAHALNNVGTAKVSVGDPSGIADLESAVAIAMAMNSPEAPRAMNNLASSVITYGEVERAYQLWREAFALASKIGNFSVARFAKPTLAVIDYFEGAWDSSLARLDAFIAEIEESGGHVQESPARSMRARIRFARGDLVGAQRDADDAVAAGRRIGGPQSLLPSLTFMAILLTELGRESKASELADEILALQLLSPDDFYVDAAVLLVQLGRGAELRRVAEQMSPTPWRALADALIDDQPGLAADLAEELRAGPIAAYVRLRAARQLVDLGRIAEARGQLAKATDFWRSVGASRYLDQAEELKALITRQQSAKRSAARASPS
jgi:class 3 adenylate cyclase/tetratricopeptide (TPR) repeat protein